MPRAISGAKSVPCLCDFSHCTIGDFSHFKSGRFEPIFRSRSREIVMRLATQSSTQLHTIFGSGYVLEQRGDQSQHHLPQSDDRGPVLDFGKILATLRAALSLR
jgi:hypothetical protein